MNETIYICSYEYKVEGETYYSLMTFDTADSMNQNIDSTVETFLKETVPMYNADRSTYMVNKSDEAVDVLNGVKGDPTLSIVMTKLIKK